MTTRGSLARGQGQQQFQGNVQKWVRQWVEPGITPGASKVALLKWVPTGEQLNHMYAPAASTREERQYKNLKLACKVCSLVFQVIALEASLAQDFPTCNR